MRPRINDRLARATQFPTTLIVAPAGFGKSMALRDFLLTSRLEVVRCDVRSEDDTLLAFARHLGEALRPLAPSAPAAFPEMQQRIMETGEPIERLCEWFVEHLKRVSGTIVVDDLHYADPAAIAFVVDLIDRTYERIRWIIATRSDGELPVASWLAYDRMDMPIDENTLRFTPEEALAAADEAQSGIEPDQVEALREFTEGWPAALAIALRTRTYASELRTAAGAYEAATREMIYRYLAEQVFTGLSPAQQNFLLATSVFSTFDVGVAEALGGMQDFINDLRRGVAFLNEIAPGIYRYHDLFTDFLESELRRQGESAWAGVLCHGGQLLEDRGDDAAALALFLRAGDVGSILRVVERSGFGLFERGHGDALSAALDIVPDSIRNANAAAVGLRATLDAARGHFDLCRRGFVAAIELAQSDELRLALVHRYAIELVRHDQSCIDLLEPYANDDRVAAAMRVPLLGTLATGFARVGRVDEALATIARALDAVDASTDDDTVARLYQQAAYVYRLEPTHQNAQNYANRAVDLARARNLNELAVRAYSVLYQIAYDDGDDPIVCLGILDKLLECARKGGSTQARLYGLLATYGIEAERGNEAALERLDREVQAISGGLPRVRAEVLLPAMALRAGWNRDFHRAYELLAGTADLQSNDERRAHRASELALYAFAAGMHAEGEAALADAVAALGLSARSTRRTMRARLTIACAEILRGHDAAAHRHLTEVERDLVPAMRWLRAFAHAARTLYRAALGQADRPVVAAAFERLRAEQQGGIARLLEAMPFPHSTEGGYSSLTPAEREILHLLATGASTKEIAAKTARSPRTVDTHIRSLCQKLRCSGRRAAVALATGSGWVRSA
jgi:LuxR family transcriptional regulator, maltose regulon positive regulatory protein